MTLSEARWQWRNGQGQTLVQDTNQLDLSGATLSSFGGQPNRLFRTRGDQFFVHGTITLVRHPGGQVGVLTNTFNFDMKPWAGNFIRNSLTIGGRMVAGPGQPFDIVFGGTAPIPP